MTTLSIMTLSKRHIMLSVAKMNVIMTNVLCSSVVTLKVDFALNLAFFLFCFADLSDVMLDVS